MLVRLLGWLIAEIDRRLPGIKSENNRYVSDWVNNTVWQIEHSTEAIKNKNIPKLVKLIEQYGYSLSFEVIERRVYASVLQRVKDAGLAEWAVDPKSKTICQQEFNEWLKKLVVDVANSSMAGDKVKGKMEKVSIPSDYIISALDERRRYRQESLEPHYLEFSDKELIEGEISVALQHLRLDLDMGKYEPGLPFYKVCLDRLRDLQLTVNTKTTPPLFYLNGCMHDITDRCGHRYHQELV